MKIVIRQFRHYLISHTMRNLLTQLENSNFDADRLATATCPDHAAVAKTTRNRARRSRRIPHFRRLCFMAGLIGMTLLFYGSIVMAAEYQPHESIRQAAREYILSKNHSTDGKIELDVGRLDRRLRLAKCDKPLTAFSPPGKGSSRKWSVGIRCNGTEPWSIYVPVSIHIKKYILVAAREIPRGSIIDATDLMLAEHDVSRIHNGFFQQTERVIGKTAKRGLHPGDIITPGKLASTSTVKRGNQVTILAKIGQIKVRMTGKALSDGAIGERIRVQNKSSKRRIEAIVVAPGIVEVPL